MTVLEYNELLDRVSSLPRQQKADLLAELESQMHTENPTGRQRSIRELRGLGKEIWAGIDAQEYVDRERDSWDG